VACFFRTTTSWYSFGDVRERQLSPLVLNKQILSSILCGICLQSSWFLRAKGSISFYSICPKVSFFLNFLGMVEWFLIISLLLIVLSISLIPSLKVAHWSSFPPGEACPMTHMCCCHFYALLLTQDQAAMTCLLRQITSKWSTVQLPPDHFPRKAFTSWGKESFKREDHLTTNTKIRNPTSLSMRNGTNSLLLIFQKAGSHQYISEYCPLLTSSSLR
jgi:hypothetical protein